MSLERRRHYGNGRLYEVIGQATWERDGLTQMVVYKDVQTNKLYYRTPDEFYGLVTLPSKQKVPRYALAPNSDWLLNH